MQIQQLFTREFKDAVTAEVSLLILKTHDGRLAIGLSKKDDGDIDVTLPDEIEQALWQALNDRRAVAGSN